MGKVTVLIRNQPIDTAQVFVRQAKRGFDPLMGARPMQRLIQDTIRRALADELLFGRLTEGGRLTVDLVTKTDADGKEINDVELDIQPLPKKEGKAKPEEATAG